MYALLVKETNRLWQEGPYSFRHYLPFRMCPKGSHICLVPEECFVRLLTGSPQTINVYASENSSRSSGKGHSRLSVERVSILQETYEGGSSK